MTAMLPSTIIYLSLLLPFVLNFAENGDAFHTTAFVPRSASWPPITSNLVMMSAATPIASTFSGTIDESSDLYTALRKPSKTLSVILEIDMPLGGGSDDAESKISVADIASRSMQLRKLKASALATSDVQVAAELVKEQATAQGKEIDGTNLDGWQVKVDSSIVSPFFARKFPWTSSRHLHR